MTDADPLMVELFKKVPPPGSVWPVDQRMLWLDTCEAALNLIYGPVEKIDIPALFIRTGLSAEAIEGLRAKSGGIVIADREAGAAAAPPEPAAAAPQPEAVMPAAPEERAEPVPPKPSAPPEPAPKEVKVAAPAMSGRAPAEVAPRPAGIPTTFTMIQIILGKKPGLTARELVEAMAAQWWPELEFKRVAPDISTWITKGRIARDADGKLTLTEQGRNVPSIEFRKPESPPPERLPDSVREMIDPIVRPVVESSNLIVEPKSPPGPTKQISAATERFLELRARAQAAGSAQIIKDDPVPVPTPPQPPKAIAPPPGAARPFDYGSKTIMLSLKEHRILSKLKAAMGKGMLDGMHLVSVAFAGEAAKVSNSEVYLREVMEQLGPRLEILGLEMVSVPTMPGSTRIAGYVLRAR